MLGTAQVNLLVGTLTRYKMNIDDFLKQFIEGYLFHDLESMSKIVLPAGQDDGAAGYPIIATTLAGMELLGNLLWPGRAPFDPKNKSNDYFLNYWDNYFCKLNPQYTGLGRLFRQLIRNGIAHTFLAKNGIFIEKGTNRQTSIDTVKKEIYVDCNVFYKEFEDSYLKLVKPIIDGTVPTPPTTKANMQFRLNDVNDIYSRDSARLFLSILPLHSSTIDTTNRTTAPVSPLFSGLGKASGASGTASPFSPVTTHSYSSTATVPPSTTIPFSPTPSGTLPPKSKP